MDTPLVTIIVPVYNSEKYLEECIQNLLNQTYHNLQIVLVNDGSTDHSLDICNRITDSRVEVYTKQNGGASSARNLGLTHRKGEYVLFVDSDDYLKNNAVETLVSTAVSNHADCVYYEADNVAEDTSIKVKKDGLSHAVQYPTTDGNSLIELILERKNYHAVPFLYFAKSNLYDKGLRFEEGIMFEDELFSFELLRMCGKVVCLKQKLYFRNVRSGSVMTSSGKEEFRFQSITVVFERLLEQFAKSKDDKVLNIYLSRIAMLWLDYYRQLSNQSRDKFSDKFSYLRSQILQNNGFGNKELVVRCYGEKLWMAYIAPNRVMKKLKRK